MKIRSNGIAYVLLPALLISAAAVGENLISNGSFETVVPTVPTDGACFTFVGTECLATDWSVLSGHYAIGNGPGNANGSSYGIPQPDPNGDNALILQQADAIASQKVTLPASGKYSLTFYLANRQYELDGLQTVTVSLDNELISGGKFADIPYSWTKESLSFSATAGTHTLTFAGLGNNGADVSAFLDEVVLQPAEIPTTTTLKASPTTAPQGEPISLNALVAATTRTATPAGTVTFTSGTKTLGKVTVNGTGQATLTTNSLPVGSDSIIAVYSGSSTFDSSTSSTVKVAITAAPVVSFTPSSVSFPSTIVGTASEDQAVTLTNTGSRALSIASIGLKGTQADSFIDISACGISVAVGKSCAIYVGFSPKQSGSATVALSVADNAAGSPQTVTVTGTGVAAKALTLAPTALVFPSTAVGGTSEGQSVTLTNSGTAVVAITSIALKGADPGDFVTLSNCGANLAAGASCTALVAFSPTAAGNRTGTLSVTDDVSASPQVVTLSGTGN
jgi:hypothetical protein